MGRAVLVDLERLVAMMPKAAWRMQNRLVLVEMAVQEVQVVVEAAVRRMRSCFTIPLL